MKAVILLCLLLVALVSPAQESEAADRKLIENNVNLFFKALETKDTVLYKSLVFPNGQIWTVGRYPDSLKNSTRTFQGDMVRLAKSTNGVIEERPFLIEIKIHSDIAIAWVPYTISIGGKFSHCGIDVFTFLNTKEGWKILNSAYSIEPDGCEALKKKYNLK